MAIDSLHRDKRKNTGLSLDFINWPSNIFKTDCRFFIPILMLLFTLNNASLNAQVVINEILPNGTVELKNIGDTTVDVSGYWLCDFPAYQRISDSNLQCGATSMNPGDILTVDNFNTISWDDGEMGLYTSSAFSSSAAIVDYVEWGSSGHGRSSVAVAAGIWSTDDFVPAFSDEESLQFDGDGNESSDWAATSSPTICAENSNVVECLVEGGTISTMDDTVIC
ncbi:MAG: hypothetical protein AAFO07_32830, partial [Bacteroidota bacterium]